MLHQVQSDRRPSWGQALVLTLTLLLGATVSQLWRLRRRTAQRRRGSQEPSAPPDDHPVATAAGDLFDRRLSYIERVINEPDRVAQVIHDPILGQRLRDGRVTKNTHLFACAAALEEALQGKTFENRPSNTYTAYLRPRFKRRGWPWPKGVDQWRAFFADRASVEEGP